MDLASKVIGDILVKIAEISRGFGGFDVSRPNWDIFVILFFLIAVFLYGISLGRNRVIIILVSIYMALALINAFPYTDQLIEQFQDSGTFAVRVTSFVAIVLILFFLLSHSALRAALSYPTKDDSSWFQIMLFSILKVGLVVSVIISYSPDSFREGLSPITLKLFGTGTALFWWILFPILAMSMIRKKRDRKPLG